MRITSVLIKLYPPQKLSRVIKLGRVVRSWVKVTQG